MFTPATTADTVQLCNACRHRHQCYRGTCESVSTDQGIRRLSGKRIRRDLFHHLHTPFPDNISSTVISTISSSQRVVGQPLSDEHLRLAGIDSAAAAPHDVSEGGVLHVLRPVIEEFSSDSSKNKADLF